MGSRKEIMESELSKISGGEITYTWNGEEGSIGINGCNNFKLLDKDGFISYYKKVKDSMPEKDILKNLYSMGIIESF